MQNVVIPLLRPSQCRAGITVRRAIGEAGARSWKKQRSPGEQADRACNIAQRESRLASAPANGVPTSNWCLIARELGEPFKMRKQKIAISAGALIDDAKKWKAIDCTKKGT
jgi:hypothetical protein